MCKSSYETRERIKKFAAPKNQKTSQAIFSKLRRLWRFQRAKSERILRFLRLFLTHFFVVFLCSQIAHLSRRVCFPSMANVPPVSGIDASVSTPILGCTRSLDGALFQMFVRTSSSSTTYVHACMCSHYARGGVTVEAGVSSLTLLLRNTQKMNKVWDTFLIGLHVAGELLNGSSSQICKSRCTTTTFLADNHIKVWQICK